jgi:hypothetical protein
VIEKISKFTPSEITLGHVLPTGVVIDKWKTEDEDGGTVWVFLTAAGMGCAFAESELVGVVGLVGSAVLEILRDEFSANYVEATGDEMEFLASPPTQS